MCCVTLPIVIVGCSESDSDFIPIIKFGRLIRETGRCFTTDLKHEINPNQKIFKTNIDYEIADMIEFTMIWTRQGVNIKPMLKAKLFYVILCISFMYVIWIEVVTTPNIENDVLAKEAMQNVAQDFRYLDVYRKKNKLAKDLKYILLWTPIDFAPFYFFGKEQRHFLKHKCSMINCFVTTDRQFFGGDLTRFNLIAFNGRNMKKYDLPDERSPKQKYIFFNSESADNYPECNKQFDNFFNWTATYRLDSDIPFPYILIRDAQGNVVGPKIDMKWQTEFPEVDDELAEKLLNKTKAAAWFVSNCSTRSKRTIVARDLQKALSPYGHTIDIYGRCGKLVCPRSKYYCSNSLEQDYFFYLAFENSLAEDYVTEKVLTALNNYVVPIVYGGANYTRFLPPGSYLNAREMNASTLAATMDRIINSPYLYQQFFRWKRVYSYSDPLGKENICRVCEALNDKTMFESYSSYPQFRKWWVPYYKRRCHIK